MSTGRQSLLQLRTVLRLTAGNNFLQGPLLEFLRFRAFILRPLRQRIFFSSGTASQLKELVPFYTTISSSQSQCLSWRIFFSSSEPSLLRNFLQLKWPFPAEEFSSAQGQPFCWGICPFCTRAFLRLRFNVSAEGFSSAQVALLCWGFFFSSNERSQLRTFLQLRDSLFAEEFVPLYTKHFFVSSDELWAEGFWNDLWAEERAYCSLQVPIQRRLAC